MTFLATIDPQFKVTLDARPSNYLVNHISWGDIDETLNWTDLVLVRSTSGFPTTPDDGVQIYKKVTDSFVVTVTATGSNNSVSTVTTRYYPATTYTASTTFASITGYTSTSPSLLNQGNGRGAVFSITTNASSVPTATIVSGKEGSNYIVGDLIRFKGSDLGSSLVSTTSLGVTNKYQVFDTGADTAITTNPTNGNNYGTVGTAVYSVNGTNKKVQASKYYYSLFVRCSNTSASSGDIANTAKLTKFYWKKIGEVSCFTIKDNGTATQLLNHIPSFYQRLENGNSNTDLKNFLQLFAFHIDTYLAANSSVLKLTNPVLADEDLLSDWVKQLGGYSSSIVTVEQLRKFLLNAVHEYKYNGTANGIKELIKIYTGYNSKISSPKNLILDYNSSSFLESTGAWTPDPAFPSSYAQSSGTVFPQLPTDRTAYQSMLGQLPINGNAVSGYDIDSYSSFLAPIAYETYGTPKYALELTLTASASSTTLTVADTSNIQAGDRLLKTSGTGVFSPRTVVTAVTNGTTFKINKVPTTGFLSGDTIAFSMNTLSGVGVVSGSATTSSTLSYTIGPKRAVTATAATSTNAVTLKPAVAVVGDYVIDPTGFSVIPKGTYVRAVNTSTGTVRLDNASKAGVTFAINGTLASGTPLILSSIGPSVSTTRSIQETTVGSVSKNISSIGTDLVLASSKGIAIAPSLPYAFGMQFSAGGGTKRTTVVKVDWYDKNGVFISTSAAGTLASASLSSTTWSANQISALSPSNAAFANPRFDITGALGTEVIYIDSAQFAPPVTVSYVQANGLVSTTTAIATTTEPHNFVPGNSVTVSVPENTAFNSTTTATVLASPAPVQNSTTGVYTFAYTSASSVSTGQSVNGFAASIPANFDDARAVSVKVLADRVNLISNPNFETDATGWSNTGGSSIATTTYDTYIGSQALQITIPISTSAGSGATYSPVTTAKPIKIKTGSYYSFSGYMKTASASGINGTFKVQVTFDGGTTYTGTATQLSTTDWVRVSFAGVLAPANSTYVNVAFISDFATTGSSNAIVYLDSVLVEESFTTNPYFDGSFDGYSYKSDRDSMWEGTTNLSRSHLYNNRLMGFNTVDNVAVEGMYYA
jgi:hypothetical protein